MSNLPPPPLSIPRIMSWNRCSLCPKSEAKKMRIMYFREYIDSATHELSVLPDAWCPTSHKIKVNVKVPGLLVGKIFGQTSEVKCLMQVQSGSQPPERYPLIGTSRGVRIRGLGIFLSWKSWNNVEPRTHRQFLGSAVKTRTSDSSYSLLLQAGNVWVTH